jgi:5-formyltetrahydrofolate cyclo-ligase
VAKAGDWSGVQSVVDTTRQELDDTVLIRDRKESIRRSIHAVRRGLSEVERLAYSRRIWERVVGLPGYQHAQVLLGYMAFDHEVLTDGLMQQAMASGKQLVLPLVLGDRRDMALYAIEDLRRDVAPGYCGILEPQPRHTAAVAPETLDLALIPGVAFDLRGARLGFGVGFYDRLLSRLAADIPTVGLAFDFQVIPRLPSEPHDMWLKAIVTEQRLIWGTSGTQGDVTEGARFSHVAGERGEG